MKVKEIRDKTIPDLRKELDGLRRELFNLRIQNTTRQLENTSKIHEVRQLIARILTVIREKEINGEA